MYVRKTKVISFLMALIFFCCVITGRYSDSAGGCTVDSKNSGL